MAPVGQHTANLRRKGGLGKDADRAAQRAKQLTAIASDWNCPWPLDRQRHYRVPADLVDADGVLHYIAPGIKAAETPPPAPAAARATRRRLQGRGVSGCAAGAGCCGDRDQLASSFRRSAEGDPGSAVETPRVCSGSSAVAKAS